MTGGPAGTPDALRRDLALAPPGLPPFDPQQRPRAFIGGAAIDLEEALRRFGELAAASAAPAIAGIERLTIDGVRAATELAERLRGKLFLGRPGGARAARWPVTQTASLAEVFACEMIVWIGCDGESGPVARAIAARQLRGAFLNATLETVLRLRELMARDPSAEPIGAFKRVAAVLAPGIDPRVASQWHLLAAGVQQSVRLAVFTLPADDAANLRGALEVVTWQTGLSLETDGGIDFADGAPRPCPDLATHLARRAIDLLIDVGIQGAMFPSSEACSLVERRASKDGSMAPLEPRRVFIGRREAACGDADLCFDVQGAALGGPGELMRCDGIVLRLYEGDPPAATDLTADLLRRMTAAVSSEAPP